MGKTYKIIVALIIIVVVGYAGWRYYESRRAAKAGLLSENIVHNGNDWNADFTAILPAPEPAVFNAVRDIEKAHSDQIQNVTVVSQTENSKTVDLEMRGIGDQTMKLRMEFHYDPAARTISYHTIDNPAFNLSADYKFDDQGGSTLITCHQTTTMAQQVPLPDSAVSEVIKGVFVSQLESLKHTLNIASNDEPDESSEEP